MGSQGPDSEPFGYYYSGEGAAVLVAARVAWPDGAVQGDMPPSVEDGLTAAGFTESPELASDSAGGMLVYSRDTTILRAPHLRLMHAGRPARFAVVLRHGEWTSPPLFIADFAMLAEFQAAVAPMMRLLGANARGRRAV